MKMNAVLVVPVTLLALLFKDFISKFKMIFQNKNILKYLLKSFTYENSM